MPNENPKVAAQLRDAQHKLAELKAEKLRLYPPNPHPFAQADTFPKNATPEQIKRRNELVMQIEELEKQIEELQGRLYIRG